MRYKSYSTCDSQSQSKRVENPQLAFCKCRHIANSISELVLRKVALQVLDENKQKF